MKIIIASDSFKGTLSSEDVANTLSLAINKKIKADIITIPIADGGEGLVDCFKKIFDGEIKHVNVTGPNFQKVDAKYLLYNDTAFIEMAEACGLPKANPKETKETTTFGVGEIILDAKKNGAKKIYLGLGGSATTDAGCGMAAALGTKFYDKDGKEFLPVGKNLDQIEKVLFCKTTTLTALCDVKNPMFGENGAAYIFGPQKGATTEDVILLDNGLKHLANVLERQGCKDFNVEGSGAAGAMGAGIIAFFDGKLRRGIDIVLDAVDFDNLVKDATYVITGEGSLDAQSFSGKVIDGIIARSKGTKVIAIVGISMIDNPNKYGIEKVFETNYLHKQFDEIKKTAQLDLTNCAEKLVDYLLSQER